MGVEGCDILPPFSEGFFFFFIFLDLLPLWPRERMRGSNKCEGEGPLPMKRGAGGPPPPFFLEVGEKPM